MRAGRQQPSGGGFYARLPDLSEVQSGEQNLADPCQAFSGPSGMDLNPAGSRLKLCFYGWVITVTNLLPYSLRQQGAFRASSAAFALNRYCPAAPATPGIISG